MFWTVQDTLKVNIPDGNLIEFGVYNGKCLEQIVKGFKRPFKEVWGFDSFCGLPKDASEEGNPEWHAGSFNVCNDGVPGGFSSVEDAIKFITERVGRPDIKLIQGWFKDSLTPELGKKLQNSVSYIHIDCDLGSSTKTVLNWLFYYRVPMIGCIVRYDDFISQTNGQIVAHQIATEKYNINWNQIAYNVFIYQG